MSVTKAGSSNPAAQLRPTLTIEKSKPVAKTDAIGPAHPSQFVQHAPATGKPELAQKAGEPHREFLIEKVERTSEEHARLAALPARHDVVELARPNRLAALESVSGPPKTKAALYLKSLTLNRNFDTLPGARNELYLAAVVWDESGRPPRVIPPPQLDGTAPVPYALKKDEKLTMLGDGVQLWPEGEVVGGLHVHLVVMEADNDARALGAKLETLRSTVAGSELSKVLTGLGLATAPQLAAAGVAANVLAQAVGELLRSDGDDVVGVFDGTFAAERMRERRQETYDQSGVSLALDFAPEGTA